MKIISDTLFQYSITLGSLLLQIILFPYYYIAAGGRNSESMLDVMNWFFILGGYFIIYPVWCCFCRIISTYFFRNQNEYFLRTICPIIVSSYIVFTSTTIAYLIYGITYIISGALSLCLSLSNDKIKMTNHITQAKITFDILCQIPIAIIGIVIVTLIIGLQLHDIEPFRLCLVSIAFIFIYPGWCVCWNIIVKNSDIEYIMRFICPMIFSILSVKYSVINAISFAISGILTYAVCILAQKKQPLHRLH